MSLDVVWITPKQKRLEVVAHCADHCQRALGERGAAETVQSLLAGTGIFAQQRVLEVAHTADDAMCVTAIAALAPPNQPGVRLNLDERPGPPPRIAQERLHSRYAHLWSSAILSGREP